MTEPAIIRLTLGSTLDSVFVPLWHDISLTGNLESKDQGGTVIGVGNDAVFSLAMQAGKTLSRRFAGLSDHTVIETPDSLGKSLRRIASRSRSFSRVDMQATPARFDHLLVRRELAEAASLIGVAEIGHPAKPGPLAIGLWSQFIDPRLAIPLLRSRRRHPDMADIALAFSPTLSESLVLTEHQGYVLSIVGADLVGVELVALAVSAASVPDPEDRRRPWEDPIVQRATEIDLGVVRSDQIGLDVRWAGPADAAGEATLASLASLVRELLNLPAAPHGTASTR